MPLPEIRCTVSECFFWRDDRCDAKSIEVAPRRGTRNAYFEAGSIGEPAVRDSQETQCVTFRPRGGEARRPPEHERPAQARRDDAAAQGRHTGR